VKRTNHKKDSHCYHYSFACNKFKKPEERDCDKPPLPDRKRPCLGTECRARISITDSDFVNRWVLSKVVLEHNHDLVPKTSYKITTHRQIPLRFKKELEFHDDEGMPAHENISMVIKHAGGKYGKNNRPFLRHRNYI